MRKDISVEKLINGGDNVNKSELARQYNCCWRTIDRRLNPDKYKKEKKIRIYTSKLDTFNSIPNQLAKDNKKFQYKIIQNGGTSTIFGNSINWLENAGIALKCVKTKIGVPIKAYEEMESFKLYMNDVGLLTYLSNFPPFFIKSIGALNETSFGMLTENYVASQFKYNGLNLNYWQSNTSEINFILQSEKGLIIPVEVKTGTNTKSKSLNNYVKEYNPKYSIRVSAKNFGFKNNIKSVPLYAVFCLNKQSLDLEKDLS